MPVTDWYTVTDAAGKTWLRTTFTAEVCIDDPDAGVFMMVAKPIGGTAAWPALLKGDPGPSPTFAPPVLHELAYGDTTPATVTRTLVSPGTATSPPVYRDDFWLHGGDKGDDGDTVLTPSDYGTPVYTRILQVNAAGDEFELVAQKVGGQHWPVTVTEAPAGSNSSQTLSSVAVPAYPFAWRPIVAGVTVVSLPTPALLDAKVDLVARVGGSGGPVVGRCPGIGGIDRLVLPTGPDTNASTATIIVPAGVATTIEFRVEKQGGLSTFSTGVVAPSRCWVKADPIP